MNNFYKFLLAILSAVMVLFGVRHILNKSTNSSDNDTIYFYNWGDYIDPDLLTQFEEETGYKVVYETFDSNEAMMAKVEQGSTSYDLSVPSEYTVEMMRDKDLLIPLDHSKIEGLNNIDQRFLDQEFDPGNKYSIPYFWGTLGILYNTKVYSQEDVAHWKNLWDEKFKNELLIYDGARETLGVGLLANGHSLNTTDENILRDVRNDLKGFMNNVKGILADEIKMYLAQEEANIGITFSGDAAIAMEENENLDYHIPDEGANIWFDTIVIPKTAKNIEGAYALMNFLLRPEIAAQNAEYIYYSSPNKAAMEFMDEEMLADEILYPSDEIVNNLEAFKDLGQDITILYNDLFLELKIAPQPK